MKKFLAIIILSLCFIIPSQADDIRDFQIEGMSIGDSLLDYFSKEEIESRSKFYPNSKKFVRFYNAGKESKIYDTFDFHYKNDDPRYLISNITAIIFYRENIKDCFKKKNEIVSELVEMFKDSKHYEDKKQKHLADKTGKSFIYQYFFRLDSGDSAKVSCFDWSKEVRKTKGWLDHLRVGIYDEEYKLWLQNEAFK
tara:strand:+ start:1150 stop:1737 length:588 start_codon:yes stop_codon:yes gene_type:complete